MRYILLLLFSFSTIVRSEIFSSIEELTKLTTNQDGLIKEMNGLVDKLKDAIEKVNSKLKFLKEESHEMKMDVHKYVNNPLNAFVLIKSLSYDVEDMQTSLQTILNDFSKSVEQVKLPANELPGAVEGFYRLQYTYELGSAELARGYIQGEKFRKSLHIDDLYLLGKHMIPHNTTYAEEYLRLALDGNEESKILKPFTILEEMFKCHNESGKYDEAIATLGKMQQEDPENKDLLEKKLNYELAVADKEPVIVEEQPNDYSGTIVTPLKEKRIFAQACRGERLQSPAVSSKLYCFMQSTNAFTKIAPFKVEIANFHPYVAIFHEILSDAEIETFKSLVKSQLSRAHVMTSDTSSAVSSLRVAKLSWLYDNKYTNMKTFTRRVEDMSGMNMKTAEAWQVQNYGIGGHYILHQDFSFKGQKFNQHAGNRIATTLFYLSDVEKGGATVFPLLRLYIPPRKGTAAFWYNLSTSGHLEYLTLHGACPVLVGSKWVCNKWLHEYGQEKTRPCELVERPTDPDYYKKLFIL